MQMIFVSLHSTTNNYHLGNNREVVDAKGVVQQVTNYYPFGAPYADASASKGADVQPYGIPGQWYGGTYEDLHSKVGKNISSVDAIMQGAIVNYENLLYSYDPFAGIGGIVSGFAPKHILHFARTILNVQPTLIGDNPITSSWRFWNKQLSYEEISDACSRSPFVIGLVAVDEHNNFTKLTSNHFVQITGAGQDKKGGFVNYWSWGNSTEYTSRTGGQSGVFSLMVF